MNAFFDNTNLLPNRAAWLSYDEIHMLAQKAYEQSEPESLEGRFLAGIIQQK